MNVLCAILAFCVLAVSAQPVDLQLKTAFISKEFDYDKAVDDKEWTYSNNNGYGYGYGYGNNGKATILKGRETRYLFVEASNNYDIGDVMCYL